MGDAKRRRDLGLGDGMDRTVAQLHDALLDAEYLRRILMMPEFEMERVLADLPRVVRTFEPTLEGPEYDRARAWYRKVAEAVHDRIRGDS